MGGVTSKFLGYKLRRVSSLAMATLANDLGPLKLKSSEVTILLEIREHPQITSSEIGRKLGIKRANMTPVMAKLIEQGYVTSSALNGRSQGLSLTAEGEAICIKSYALIESHDESYFSALSTDERAQLYLMLGKIWDHHTD